ncbi:protein CHUP1, chloroplastic-like isoform X1 [Nymphaea colorata]|nr:protein CHUP1, chloroplastic-like isoform X1 [Nymphaea colorata]XP_031489169.1 protein CHUP1, chloroplastic-like isoform X1 [Nymphaea colorata]XP_031489170.1 protein CHUP1, chloroplastic-like isoform X1 [Nymphaea colorata]XP_031489171.1 protein CHUP1, chloroplastic-like isoform X1 [Nymphaea colorata]
MGVLKKTNEVKPLLFKLGVALAVSVAGFLYTHFRFRIRPWRPPQSSGKYSSEGSSGDCKPSETEAMVLEPVGTMQKVDPVLEPSPKGSDINEDDFLLPEFNELVLQEFEGSGIPYLKEGSTEVVSDVKETGDDATAMESEIKGLRNQTFVLQERVKSLEMQLLEYYGLKEQEKAVRELENHLKAQSMELKLLKLKMDSLQAENQRLREQAQNYSRTVEELETARAKIRLLRKQMKAENESAKAQLVAVQERVSTLQALEKESCKRDEEIQTKLQNLQDLGNETAILREMNEKLRQENLELATKLDSRGRAASASNSKVHEAEVVGKALEDVDTLKESNENLMEELERLKTNRYADVEELVYLRWINACLRYELRNFQTSPGKTVARDLSRSLSPKSEEKAKKLILEYAGSGGVPNCPPDFDLEFCSSSQASTLTDTDEFDASSLEVQSATYSSSSKRKLFNKLKRLVLGKHSPERKTSVYRNSGTFSKSERLRVSKSLLDDLTSTHSQESFSPSATAQLSSVANFSEARSKSCRVDSLTTDRITKKSRQLSQSMDSRSVSRSLSDISRTRHLRTRGTKDHKAAQQENFITTEWSCDVLDDYHATDYMLDSDMGSLRSLQEESSQLHEGEAGSEKLELLKFAEVLKNSRRFSKAQRKPGFGSF